MVKGVTFLKAADLTLRLQFNPSQKPFIAEYLKKEIETIWREFIVRKQKKYDFEVIFEDEEELLVRIKKFYGFISKKDLAKKKYYLSYSISLRFFDLILREIFCLLTQGDGFLLHCSALINKRGELVVFLAPSGGGKTTTASLTQDKFFFRFCDDILIIRKIEKKWIYYSPPFIEKEGMQKKRESSKAKVYFVKKAKKARTLAIENKTNIKSKFIRQVWTTQKIIDRKMLKSILNFIDDESFFTFDATLVKREMKDVLNES